MADVQITLTIPDAHVQDVIDSFTKNAGAKLEIRAIYPDSLNGKWNYTIEPKGAGESLQQFGKRFIKEHIKALLDMDSLTADKEAKAAQHDAIPEPQSSVPSEVIT